MTLPRVADLAGWLEAYAPSSLAESWDNVGLLVGDPALTVHSAMTCLTLTDATVREAIEQGADLVVAHHPLPFRPVNRLTTDTTSGRLLWELAAARICVYSPHTAFDSAARGINQRWAEGLQLADIQVLAPAAQGPWGGGRHGQLPAPVTLEQLAERVKSFVQIAAVQSVGRLPTPIAHVGVACGSAAEFIPLARAAGCDCLVTGEARFHAVLEAESLGLALILAGHYASERFGVECLADELAAAFPAVTVWASRRESDPLAWH